MGNGQINPLDIMEECAQLALLGKGKTKTNPIVGAMVVKDGKIIGRGFHEEFGGAHAEVNAIDSAEESVVGADLYVTLEPCGHHGKTPPCVDKIIASGIKRVFVGAVDPNPLNAGKSIEKLAANGIEVYIGYLESICASIIEDFIKLMLTKKPYYSVKSAQTMDGKIATRAGDSKWITSKSSRVYAHYLRAVSDAVIVGVDTVIADDPRLTVREMPCDVDPYKVVLDPSGRMPMECRLITETKDKVIVVTSDKGYAEKLEKKDIKVIIVDNTDNGLDLDQLSVALVGYGIMNALVEGGAETVGRFFDAGLADRGYFFIAPIVAGGKDAVAAVAGKGVEKISEAYKMIDPQIRHFENDLLITGRFNDYVSHVVKLTEAVRNRCACGCSGGQCSQG